MLDTNLTIGKDFVILVDTSYQRTIMNTIHILKEYVYLKSIV
jgi:hypothetical protein